MSIEPRKEYFDLLRQYEQKRLELGALYRQLVRLRSVAGINDDIPRLDIAETPETAFGLKEVR